MIWLKLYLSQFVSLLPLNSCSNVCGMHYQKITVQIQNHEHFDLILTFQIVTVCSLVSSCVVGFFIA